MFGFEDEDGDKAEFGTAEAEAEAGIDGTLEDCENEGFKVSRRGVLEDGDGLSAFRPTFACPNSNSCSHTPSSKKLFTIVLPSPPSPSSPPSRSSPSFFCFLAGIMRGEFGRLPTRSSSASSRTR